MTRLAALVTVAVLAFAAPAAADILPPDWKPGDPAPEPALPLPQPKSGCSRRVGGDDALAAILVGASALVFASRQRRLRVAR